MAVQPGVATSFFVGDATTSMTLLDIQSESVSATLPSINGNGIKGTRQHNVARVRPGPISVGGSFEFNPVTADLAYLLPKFHGANASGTSYPLGETLSSFFIVKTMASSVVYTFPAVYGDSYTLSSSYGSPLAMSCTVVGTDSPTIGSSSPTATLNTSTAMFVHSDSNTALAIAGTTYECFDFSITVSNAVGLRQANSRVATGAFATDQIITFTATIPNGDATWSTFSDGSVTASMTYTALSQSLAYSFGALWIENVLPTISPRGENMLQLSGQAFKTGSTAALVTTLDSTP